MMRWRGMEGRRRMRGKRRWNEGGEFLQKVSKETKRGGKAKDLNAKTAKSAKEKEKKHWAGRPMGHARRVCSPIVKFMKTEKMIHHTQMTLPNSAALKHEHIGELESAYVKV